MVYLRPQPAPSLNTRFQIEDLVSQNAWGVVYRASDGQTGKPVAVRRFFPAGAAGGGLTPRGQACFLSLVSRALGLRHPALRSLVAGGCDPVDGMPFVVTEWVTGESLEELLKHGKLKPQQALHLRASALEVSAQVSHALEHEAVWVDTALASIMVGNEASGHGVTFRISSSRWLEGTSTQGNLHALVQLAEDLLGWHGRVPGNKAGCGLGQWLKWLRAHADSASLAEAHARLATLTTEVEPPPDSAVVIAREPLLAGASEIALASRRCLRVLTGVAALVLLAVAGWWLFTQRAKPARHSPRAESPARVAKAALAPVATKLPPQPVAPPPAAPMPMIDPAIAAVNARAVAMQQELQRLQVRQSPPPGRRPQPDRAGEVLSVFAPQQTEELMATRNREVVVEGVLVEVLAARSGRHLYLEFSKPGPPYVTRGILYVENRDQMAVKARIDAWVGKRVRMYGKIDIERFRAGNIAVARPKIPLRGLDAIKLME